MTFLCITKIFLFVCVCMQLSICSKFHSSSFLSRIFSNIETKADIGRVINRLQLSTAIEIVSSKNGIMFANAATLTPWTTCLNFTFLNRRTHGAEMQIDDRLISNFTNVSFYSAEHNYSTHTLSSLFPDSSLSFIYLGESTQNLHCDLVHWWPKLRVGGVLAGYHSHVPFSHLDDGHHCGNKTEVVHVHDALHFHSWSHKAKSVKDSSVIMPTSLPDQGVELNLTKKVTSNHNGRSRDHIVQLLTQFATKHKARVFLTEPTERTWLLSPKGHTVYHLDDVACGLAESFEHNNDHMLVSNILHMVILNPGRLHYYVYIHMLSAICNNKGAELYVHVYETPTGKLWNSLFRTGRVTVMHVAKPVTIFGQVPERLCHQSDVIRMKALRQYGGVYLDLDVLVLQSFDPYRNVPMTMGRQNQRGTTQLCNAVIIAANTSSFLHRWYDSYRTVDFSNREFQSVILPGELSDWYKKEIVVELRKSFFGKHEDFFWGDYRNFTGIEVGRKIVTEETLYNGMYAQHMWANSNAKLLESLDVEYFCMSTEGYAHMARFALRNTNFMAALCTTDRRSSAAHVVDRAWDSQDPLVVSLPYSGGSIAQDAAIPTNCTSDDGDAHSLLNITCADNLSQSGIDDSNIVSNILHMVILNGGCLHYYVYIHMLSAICNNKGAELYVHVYETPTGKLWNSLFRTGRVTVMHVAKPVTIFGAVPIKLCHQSDVIRMKALRQYGGVYLDLDVLVLRDFVRYMNIPMTMGRQNMKGTTQLCNAVIIAANTSSFLHRWYDSYRTVDFSDREFQSVILPGQLSNWYPLEINVEKRKAFFEQQEDFFWQDYKIQVKAKSLRNEEVLYWGMIAQHMWANTNSKMLESLEVNYFCRSNHGYAHMSRFALRDSNWFSVACGGLPS